METVWLAFLLLSGLPLLAFVLSAAWVLAVRRNRDLARDEWTAGTADRRAEQARLLIVLAYAATKFFYGVVLAFFLALKSGAFSGFSASLDLGLSFPVFCAVFGTVNALATLADGWIGASAVRNEVLTEPDGFRSTFIKLCLVEFLAICGLLTSMLIIIYAGGR